MQTLVNIEVIPYRNFKEKMRITKKYSGCAKVEDLGNAIYVLKVVRISEWLN